MVRTALLPCIGTADWLEVARLGRPNVAYDLAERYRDFKSLVALCNDPQIGSTVRVGFYIDKYKQDFAFALYQYYLEQGALLHLPGYCHC